MSRKSRGINAERDLIHKFWSKGWAAVRSAGSGSSQFPAPDVVAANNVRKLAFEVKLTTDDKKYLTKKEVNELVYFSEKFGAEPWIAVKFFHEPWFFLSVEDLKDVGKSFLVSLDIAKNKGLLFDELINF